jgi:hypothetical protein
MMPYMTVFHVGLVLLDWAGRGGQSLLKLGKCADQRRQERQRVLQHSYRTSSTFIPAAASASISRDKSMEYLL